MPRPIFDLNDSVLYITERSPFARRVRLALLETGIRFEERVLDLMKYPHPEYAEVNPLKRVPSLVLKSGEILVDSHEILSVLHESVESPLIPWDREDLLMARYWSGVSIGMCEKIIEYFFEMLRPEASRDREIIAEALDAAANVLRQLEARLESRETLIDGGITQADLDAGSMLGYLSLRISPEWMKDHPNVARYFSALDARPSFAATRPPAPAP